MAIGAAWADGSWDDASWAVGAWAQPAVDETAPTLVSAIISGNGNNISISFDEEVTFGAGGNTGFTVTLSGGAATLTYSSGSGTDTLVYSISRTIQYDETGTIDYTQPTDGVEDLAGNDLVTFSGESITNNSAQGSPAPNFYSYIKQYPGLTGGMGDKQMQFLAAQGFSEGTVNDRMYAWLIDTYTDGGSISDMLKQWEEDNL